MLTIMSTRLANLRSPRPLCLDLELDLSNFGFERMLYNQNYFYADKTNQTRTNI